MSDGAVSGMIAVQARIASLQSLVAPAPSRGTAGATGLTDTLGFADLLALVSGQGASVNEAGPSGAAPGAATGDQAVRLAHQYLGVPYRWGGSDPSSGLDCSGLTSLVFEQLGIDLPRVSADQAKVGAEVASIADAKPGDLVFFGSPVHHVGIYIGDGKMINAPHRGEVVKVQKLWGTPTHIRRVLPDGVPAAGALQATPAGARSAGATGLDVPYGELFAAAGTQYGVDPALLAAVAKAESGFDKSAVSRAGARGLMQLMPGTARELGVDPMRPAEAVDGAARLLSRHLHSFGGRMDLALAAYNAGPGAVRKFGGVPPYAETRNYVERVTRYWGELR